MIKVRAWPVRAMYMLIAAALVMSLIIMAAPAHKVSAADCADAPDAKWSKVSTPTETDWVLAPCSIIVDFAVAAGGQEAYAIVYSEVHDNCPGCVTCEGEETQGPYYLLKSDDGAATWESVTKGIKTLIDKKFAGNNITKLLQVACDAADPNYVYVALNLTDGKLYVFASTDGGSTFKDTATITGLVNVVDLEVSPAVDNVREIAISGSNGTVGKIFRYVESAWEDTSKTADYLGWISCKLVADIRFSPSWETDHTIVAVTANNTDVYLQTGTWGDSPVWKDKAVVTGEIIPLQDLPGGAIAGVTLPLDYSGTKADTRWLWVWVNYIHASTKVGEIYYVKGDNKNPIGMQIEGKPWLTHVSYQGYRAEGKAIAGLWYPEGNCGEGIQCFDVQTYRIGTIKNMDLCGTCEPWLKACKPPTGALAMAAFYVSEDKAYAVAKDPSQSCYDEGAWSVSFDDGDTWNQVSLIDTKIDYLSDVAVSPDCNKTMLVSANVHKVDISYEDGDCACECDSVWLHAVNYPEAGYGDDDIGYDGQWLRTWCGQLEGNNAADFPNYPQRGLLRLAPPVNGDQENEMGYTVYLVDRMTTTVYWNELEGLACWNSDEDCGRPKIDNIVDLAVKDKETIYALSADGKVAMADEYACSWDKPVDSLVCGWTIAVHGDYVLVGDAKGEVSYSDDGGATFTKIEKATPVVGRVTVAFDSYFDQNDTIYAAVDGLGATDYCDSVFASNDGELGGIYRWVIDKSVTWQDLGAMHYAYTGLVLGRNPGNPKTSKETGGVLYASYIYGEESYGGESCTYNGYTFTGVARSLNPNETSACKTCVTWDYLIVPLTAEELFTMAPHALKICGCKDETTNAKLFAIDGLSYTDDGLPCESGCPSYDMCEGKDGTVWTFEDCYAKKAPELTLPAVVPADPCTCYSAPFSVTWDCLCDACQFEVEFALDEDFTMPVAVGGEMGTGDNPSFSVMGGLAGGLSCEMDYYVRVRASESGTCQVIHSWWSEPVKFTVAPSVEAGIITLVAPAPGALNQPTKNVGFSWDLQADADAFDWVLSKNADLSAPLDSKNQTGTACKYSGVLDYDTTYYWQVKAYNEGALLGTSSVGTFTTGVTGAFCSAIDGLCFETRAELEAHNAELTKEAPTPFWVWVVIAIGALLVIVVIVLIFRTRRV